MATENQILNAYNAALKDIANAADYTGITRALGRRDIDGVIDALDFDEAAFDSFRSLLVETYGSGGVSAIDGTLWPSTVRWNSATSYAESYARDQIGAMITQEIKEGGIEGVRRYIGDALAFGRSRNQVALDIVGRVGANGVRSGGMVGLNGPQAQWVANARRYLESGDYAAFNRLKLATSRYKGFSQDRPMTATQIDNAMKQYTNRVLRYRGLTIARTERGSALNNGMMEGYRQAAEKTGIPTSVLIKEWVHAGVNLQDRPDHLAANGDKVRGLDTPFIIGVDRIQFPHAPGLPARHAVNCGCRVKVTVPKNWRSLSGTN